MTLSESDGSNDEGLSDFVPVSKTPAGHRNLSPPRPRVTLRIGVVGHRPNRLQNTDSETLQSLIGETLLAIDASIGRVQQNEIIQSNYSPETPELRVVTGIAFGTDHLALKSVQALRKNDKLQDPKQAALWKLELVSPAPLDVAALYAWPDRTILCDDASQELNAFRAHWDDLRAKSDSIAELPVTWRKSASATAYMKQSALLAALFDDEHLREVAKWGAEHGYEISHAHAADFLLRNVDLLLVYWDGGPSAGAGGTVDIMNTAHAAGLPVIVSRLEELHIGPRLLVAFKSEDTGQEIVGLNNSAGEVVLADQAIKNEALDQTLLLLLAPPVPNRQAHIQKDHSTHERVGNDPDPLQQYYQEALTPFESSRTYESFLDLWLGKKTKTLSAIGISVWRRLTNLGLIIRANLPHAERSTVDAAFRLNPRSLKDASHWSKTGWDEFLSQNAVPVMQANKTMQVLHRRFAIADLLAVDYANRYRSSVILSYFLSTVAVTLAIIGVTFAGDNKVLKAGLLAAEFGIISWILVMVAASRRDRHHTKLVQYRALAESLRHVLVMSRIGEYPATDTRASTDTSWINWYVRAAARELGIPSVKFDPDFLAGTLKNVIASEVDPQISYHKKTAHKLEHVNHGLHAFGNDLFSATLVSVSLGIAMVAGYFLMPHPGWSIALKITGAAAAILPAIGAALTGIRYALDLETKAERHEDMARELETLSENLTASAVMKRWADTREALATLERLLIRDIDQFHSNYARRSLTVPA